MTTTTFNRKESRVEWTLIISILGLMFIGAAFIYSAKTWDDSVAWHGQFFVRQIVWYVAGTLGAVAICFIDYHFLARWSMVAYWVTIAMLVAVMVPGIGTKVGGAQRWFDLHFFRLQPSEFAKLSFIFVQAHFLSRPIGELQAPGVFFRSVALTALPFFLILKEPDLGSALVLLPVTMAMMVVAGIPPRYLIRVVTVCGILVTLLVVDVLFAPQNLRLPLEEYQRHRLLVYFGRDFASPDATEKERRAAKAMQKQRSYQVEQALISVGSGGLTGKGWQQGQQIALGYLPPGASHNDFIFSVIAEEKGFLGSVVVISLYALVLFSGIRIADQARDHLGRLLAVGVVTLLFSHVFVNIGMNIRLMPVTGIPLPLLSYGGSSVLCSLIAIGILQNVYLHQRR